MSLEEQNNTSDMSSELEIIPTLTPSTSTGNSNSSGTTTIRTDDELENELGRLKAALNVIKDDREQMIQKYGYSLYEYNEYTLLSRSILTLETTLNIKILDLNNRRARARIAQLHEARRHRREGIVVPTD